MAREHLEQRDNWQDESAVRGKEAENAFRRFMGMHLAQQSALTTKYKPKDLEGISEKGCLVTG